jgi:tryptophan synthase beta chain
VISEISAIISNITSASIKVGSDSANLKIGITGVAAAKAKVGGVEAGVEFARVEGILPAPEANHAVKAAMDEAIRCREEGDSQAILFNLCGHGHFDMSAYDAYLAGKLEDPEFSEADMQAALERLPETPAIA